MDVLLDTNVIIDLIELGCFARVLGIRGFRFWVVNNVTQEIMRPSQRAVLQEELRRGALCETYVEGIEEVEVYVNLRAVLADGEAASLAVAAQRGWTFATYEKGRTEREALRLLGRNRYLRTPQLIAAAIRKGTMTLEDLDVALVTMTLSVPTGDSMEDQKARRLLTHLKRVRAEVMQLLERTAEKQG